MHCRRRFFGGSNDVPGFFVPCVCVMHCRRRFFFGKNEVPECFRTCNSPVEVFLRAAGVFSRKNDVPLIFRTCTSPVEDILPAAGALFPENSDSQMALAIFVMGEEL